MQSVGRSEANSLWNDSVILRNSRNSRQSERFACSCARLRDQSRGFGDSVPSGGNANRQAEWLSMGQRKETGATGKRAKGKPQAIVIYLGRQSNIVWKKRRTCP